MTKLGPKGKLPTRREQRQQWREEAAIKLKDSPAGGCVLVQRPRTPTKSRSSQRLQPQRRKRGGRRKPIEVQDAVLLSPSKKRRVEEASPMKHANPRKSPPGTPKRHRSLSGSGTIALLDEVRGYFKANTQNIQNIKYRIENLNLRNDNANSVPTVCDAAVLFQTTPSCESLFACTSNEERRAPAEDPTGPSSNISHCVSIPVHETAGLRNSQKTQMDESVIVNMTRPVYFPRLDTNILEHDTSSSSNANMRTCDGCPLATCSVSSNYNSLQHQCTTISNTEALQTAEITGKKSLSENAPLLSRLAFGDCTNYDRNISNTNTSRFRDSHSHAKPGIVFPQSRNSTPEGISDIGIPLAITNTVRPPLRSQGIPFNRSFLIRTRGRQESARNPEKTKMASMTPVMRLGPIQNPVHYEILNPDAIRSKPAPTPQYLPIYHGSDSEQHQHDASIRHARVVPDVVIDITPVKTQPVLTNPHCLSGYRNASPQDHLHAVKGPTYLPKDGNLRTYYETWLAEGGDRDIESGLYLEESGNALTVGNNISAVQKVTAVLGKLKYIITPWKLFKCMSLRRSN